MARRRGHRFSHIRVAFQAAPQRRSKRPLCPRATRLADTKVFFSSSSSKLRSLGQVLAAAGEYLGMFCFSDDTTFIPYKPTETTCGQQVYLVSALADLSSGCLPPSACANAWPNFLGVWRIFPFAVLCTVVVSIQSRLSLRMKHFDGRTRMPPAYTKVSRVQSGDGFGGLLKCIEYLIYVSFDMGICRRNSG